MIPQSKLIQKALAASIAQKLKLKEPDYTDDKAVQEFIEKNKAEYEKVVEKP